MQNILNPIEQSSRFNSAHRIGEDEKIAYGYKDGGRGLQFGTDGKPLNEPNREIIVVRSPQEDFVLQKAIEGAKAATRGLSTTEEKARFLMKYIQRLLPENDPDRNEAIIDQIAGGQGAVGVEISLGQLINARTGLCRHRSLLFKVIADEIGIPTALVRGNYREGSFSLWHAWNEVVLENKNRLVVDVMQDFIGGSDNRAVENYADVQNNFLYREGFLQQPFNEIAKRPGASPALEVGIARQNWINMTSPTDGVVKRADASDMNPSQRTALLNELKRHGIDANIVHSNTFGRDFVQVRERDFVAFERARDSAPSSVPPQVNMAAQQNWESMNSPREGAVLRADSSGMSEAQRNTLLQNLRDHGIDAKIVHSKTFNRDYIQVQENDFARLTALIAVAGDLPVRTAAMSHRVSSRQTPQFADFSKP